MTTKSKCPVPVMNRTHPRNDRVESRYKIRARIMRARILAYSFFSEWRRSVSNSSNSHEGIRRSVSHWLFSGLFLCSLCLHGAENTGVALDDPIVNPPQINAAWLRTSDLGNEAYNVGDYLQAISFFQQAKTQAKDREELQQTYERLIATYLKAFFPGEAAREIEEYAQKLPDVGTDRRQLYQADVLLLQRNYAEAEKILNSLQERNAISGGLYFHLLSSLGYAKRMQKKWDEATKVYLILEKAGAGQHWEFTAFLNRVYCMIKGDKFTESAAELNDVERFKREKNFHEVDILRFIMLIENQKFVPAAEFYTQLNAKLKETPNQLLYNAQIAAARHFINSANPLDAVVYLSDAFHTAPSGEDRRLAMRQLVNVYFVGNDRRSAVETAEKYLEFYKDAPDSFDVRMKISKLYAGMQDYKEALNVIQVVIDNEELPMKKRIEAAFQAAMVCLASDDLTAAVPQLEFIRKNGLTLDQREEASFILGTSYFKNNSFPQALAVFSNSAGIASKWQGRCLIGKVKTLIELKSYTDALAAARTTVELESSNEDVEQGMYYTAYVLNLLKRPIEAVRAYNALADKYPEGNYAADALFEAGNLYFEIRDYPRAAEMTSRFIKDFPQHKNAAAVLYRSVFASFLGGNIEHALQATESLKQMYPGEKYTAAALFWKVDYLRNMQKNAEAAKLLSEMAEMFKNDKEIAARIIIDRAVVAEAESKSSEALVLLEAYFKEFPDDQRFADALFLAGDIASRNTDYATALSYYERCAKLRPGTALGRAAQGRIGDCSSALFDKNRKFDDIRRAADIYVSLLNEPELSHEMNAQTLYKLGLCRLRMDDGNGALRDFNEVIFRFRLAIKRGLKLSPVWCIKAAYAAVRLHIGRGTPEDAAAAIKIFDLMEEMNLDNDGEFNTMRALLQTKYKL